MIRKQVLVSVIAASLAPVCCNTHTHTHTHITYTYGARDMRMMSYFTQQVKFRALFVSIGKIREDVTIYREQLLYELSHVRS